MSIPKIIHLTWFSGEPYPPEIQCCLDSWKKVLPDFTVRLWTKEDALQTNIQYVTDAINCRKWAFASDVVRLYALYHWGGVYMDADMLVLDRFDDFLNEKAVLFQEYHSSCNVENQIDPEGNRLVDCVRGCGIQAAFMMAEKENPYIRCLLDYYADKRFLLDNNGRISQDELISPSIYAIASEPYGYVYKDTLQRLTLGGAVVYPSKYVAGGNKETTPDSFAIHQCENSWRDFSAMRRIIRTVKKTVKRTAKSLMQK